LVPPSGYLLHGHGVVPSICTSGIRGNDPAAVESVIAARWSTVRVVVPSTARACPAERRMDDLELIVAQRLLGDRATYVRALDPTPDVALAPN
jgi:hypothetical protein